MKKFFGLFSSFMIFPLSVGIWQLSNLLDREQNYWDNWLPFSILFITFFAIFGSFVKITGDKIKICRLLWFLHKRNTFELSEIDKVYIRNGGQAKGASVLVNFFDKDEKPIGGFSSQMLNFELRRLKRRLEELGIEVEVDEIMGNKI